MAFPTNPTNGQTASNNGVLYTYNSTLTAWTVGTEPGANLSGNNISVTSSAAVGTTLTVTGAATLSSTLAVTGTITGGNVATGGTVSASGTITGGNLVTGGTLSVTGATTTTNKITTLFAGGANLTNSTSMLEIQDTGTPAIPSMAFHRPGVYASKISFNTDNMFYFGGWSAGAGASPIVCGGAFPGATGTYDLGSTALRWRNIYTNDLQLSNGIGDYTIVEGEEDLFLYNNKTKKTFKFALIEVDPSTVPPKAKTD